MSNIPYWSGGLAPFGTPGNFFGFDDRGKSQPVQLFWAQLARYLGLHTTQDNEINGVKTFHYVFDESEVQNKTTNPTNAKYWQDGPNGLFNASSANTAAIYYSWPHFYLGDESLTDWYDGFPLPSQANDESYVEVQQVIGLSVQGKRMIQGNVAVGGIDNTTGWPYNMPTVQYWPNYIMSLESQFTDDQAQQMRDALDFYDRAMKGQQAMLIGGGLGAALAFLASLFLFYRRREMWAGKTSGLLQEEQHTEDVPIGYVESGETPASPAYGARS